MENEKKPTIIRLTKEFTFEAAHALEGYDGLCREIHGHSYRLFVTVKGTPCADESNPKFGMVMDFGDLKKSLKEICDQLDHCLIYEEDSLLPQTVAALEGEGFRLVMLPFRPTAEELARYIFMQLQAKALPIARVTVYETPTNCAIYEEATR